MPPRRTTGTDAAGATGRPEWRSGGAGRPVACVICLRDRVAWRPGVRLHIAEMVHIPFQQRRPAKRRHAEKEMAK